MAGWLTVNFIPGQADPPEGLLGTLFAVASCLVLTGMFGEMQPDDQDFPGLIAISFLMGTGLGFDSPIEVLINNTQDEIYQVINDLQIFEVDGTSRLMNLRERGSCNLADGYARWRCGALPSSSPATTGQSDQSDVVDLLKTREAQLTALLAQPLPGAQAQTRNDNNNSSSTSKRQIHCSYP